MNPMRSITGRRILAAWLALAMTLAGCANPPAGRAGPASIVLAGVVVDGNRAAAEREAGLVRVWRDGRAIDAQAGLVLVRGDFVETGPRADAVIRFPNGSTLYMRPDSRGRIGSLSEAVGEFFARIKGVFSIESSFVRAAANGTAFLVRAQADGQTSVTVLEGSVFVDSTRGAWQRIAVNAGETIVAQTRAAPVTRANEQDIRQTREWADRLDRLLPQPSGTASSVGGAIAVGVAIAAAAALLSSRDKDDKPRGGASDSTRPSTSSTLSAPAARGVGSADAGRVSAIACNRRVTLSWGAVQGARDYLVTLQTRTTSRAPWSASLTESTTRQQLDITAQEGHAYRWSVQARDGRQAGPASEMLYFGCLSTPR